MYTDKEQFLSALEQVHANKGAIQADTELTKQQKTRLQEIEREFDKAGTDIEARDKVARKHKLIVYHTGGLRNHKIFGDQISGQIGTMSVESDVEMPDPEIVYDPASNYVGFNGTARWIDVSKGVTDGSWGYGGPDAFSIVIDGIATKSAVKSQSLRTYYPDGTQAGQTRTTLMSTALQDNIWPVTIRWQDSGGSRSTFNSASVSMWVWTYGMSAPFSITSIYSHDWRSVQLESITFGPGGEGSKTWTWNFGLTWTWKFGNESWAGESNTLDV